MYMELIFRYLGFEVKCIKSINIISWKIELWMFNWFKENIIYVLGICKMNFWFKYLEFWMKIMIYVLGICKKYIICDLSIGNL